MLFLARAGFCCPQHSSEQSDYRLLGCPGSGTHSPTYPPFLCTSFSLIQAALNPPHFSSSGCHKPACPVSTPSHQHLSCSVPLTKPHRSSSIHSTRGWPRTSRLIVSCCGEVAIRKAIMCLFACDITLSQHSNH